jgi:hypothetical protein
MRYPCSVPERPPADLLVELDRAARALDALTARGSELTLEMDTRRLQIKLIDGVVQRTLSASELFELLADG